MKLTINKSTTVSNTDVRASNFQKEKFPKQKKKQMRSLVKTSLNLLEYCLAKRETKVAAERFVPLLKLSNLKCHPDTV